MQDIKKEGRRLVFSHVFLHTLFPIWRNYYYYYNSCCGCRRCLRYLLKKKHIFFMLGGMHQPQQQQPINDSYEISTKRPRMSYYNNHQQYNNPIFNNPISLLPNPYGYPFQQQSPTTSTWLTSEKMKEYLQNEKNIECIIYLFFPCCFQKSYTNERR